MNRTSHGARFRSSWMREHVRQLGVAEVAEHGTRRLLHGDGEHALTEQREGGLGVEHVAEEAVDAASRALRVRMVLRRVVSRSSRKSRMRSGLRSSTCNAAALRCIDAARKRRRSLRVSRYAAIVFGLAFRSAGRCRVKNAVTKGARSWVIIETNQTRSPRLPARGSAGRPEPAAMGQRVGEHRPLMLCSSEPAASPPVVSGRQPCSDPIGEGPSGALGG